MTFTGKSSDTIMKKFLSFRYGFIFLFLLNIVMLSGCEAKIDCKGCDKEAPWSNIESDYCYPTKAQCEATEGKECEKCN